MKGIQLTFALVLVTLLALTGCAGGPGTTTAGGDRPVPTAPLTNTYWQLAQVGEHTVETGVRDTEPHMILLDDGRVHGFSGCNRFVGQYTLQAAYLLFDSMASTKMACLDDNIEAPLYEAFSATAGVNLRGKVLKLLDEQGRELARFEAVALP
ncbi:META domain-containing protein [Salinarimonas sp. NSM]|uniref:META domain-containing protein n=1 Tax=Salinarimonas sp. NSM TaxID=3458003 RepID=UPI00403642B9